MKQLAKYIQKNVLFSTALIVVMLTGLQFFVLFIRELDDIGRGDYSVSQALIYVLLQTPYQVFLFFPMAALLGCLLGLGSMAQHSELVIARVSGMSVTQIARQVLYVAIGLSLVVLLSAEFIVPPAMHYAETRKSYEISSGQALQTYQGLWLRQGHWIIRVENIKSRDVLDKVTIYDLTPDFRLRQVSVADSAIVKKHEWILSGVESTIFKGNSVQSTKQASYVWPVNLDPQLVINANLEPASLSLKQIYRYVRQNQGDLQHGIFALSFWNRLVQPFAIVVMMLLAIPFIFGPLRSVTMGLRFLAGAAMGFGFYILNQIFGPVSLVYQIPALVSALMPTILFGILALILLLRVR